MHNYYSVARSAIFRNLTQLKYCILRLEWKIGTLNLYKHLQFIICSSKFVQVFRLGFSHYSKHKDGVLHT